MNHLLNMDGTRVGMLTVISIAGRNGFGEALWQCVCDCGKSRTVRGSKLRASAVHSCGCTNHRGRITHGETASNKRPVEYRAWQGMQSRCHNPNDDQGLQDVSIYLSDEEGTRERIASIFEAHGKKLLSESDF